MNYVSEENLKKIMKSISKKVPQGIMLGNTPVGHIEWQMYLQRDYLKLDGTPLANASNDYIDLLKFAQDNSLITADTTDKALFKYDSITDVLTLPNYALDSGEVGSILSYMGNNVPIGCLACDGTIYNITDYPDLAEHINAQFGSYNYFGGDGTTTFAVPDLRGEFLRGTGTNSHTNQGSGANVGLHQNATEMPRYSAEANRAYFYSNSWSSIRNLDSDFGTSSTVDIFVPSSTGSQQNTNTITIRPTNTSVLYCIRYKTTLIPQIKYIKGTTVWEELDFNKLMPLGTIINFMGTTAPDYYLSCDGTIYNILEYSALANFFEIQFGSKNFFGGDGTTTFAVPDLRGEFLRGSGTNSHTNQGSGDSVGVHQDATEIPDIAINSDGLYASKLSSSSNYIQNSDSSVSLVSGKRQSAVQAGIWDATDQILSHTSRPTNTSVLYCIKYK